MSQSAKVNKAFGNASSLITKVVDETLKGVTKEVASRAYRASNELRNASQYVLRGQRSGKRYRIPFSKRTYQASAPKEAPAVRTGVFRLSWGTHVHVEQSEKMYKAVSAIESNVKTPDGRLLGDLLENGSPKGQMSPRPYKQATIDKALPQIKAIYNRPYL